MFKFRLVVEDVDDVSGDVQANASDISDQDEDDDDPFKRIKQVENDFPLDQISNDGSLELNYQEGTAPADSTLNIALRRTLFIVQIFLHTKNSC